MFPSPNEMKDRLITDSNGRFHYTECAKSYYAPTANRKYSEIVTT